MSKLHFSKLLCKNLPEFSALNISRNTDNSAFASENCCINNSFKKEIILKLDSGCGAVGRAVASYTRDPRFKSKHW